MAFADSPVHVFHGRVERGLTRAHPGVLGDAETVEQVALQVRCEGRDLGFGAVRGFEDRDADRALAGGGQPGGGDPGGEGTAYYHRFPDAGGCGGRGRVRVHGRRVAAGSVRNVRDVCIGWSRWNGERVQGVSRICWCGT